MRERPNAWLAGCLLAGLAAVSECGDSGDDSPAPASVSAGSYAPRKRIDYYLSHYAAWEESDVAAARRHALVIAHPAGNLTRDLVARIRQGADPADPSDDVVVLGYISVGEDVRTVGLTDEEMVADPRFLGDGTGPRVDPRGPNADGQPLDGVDPRGAPSPAGAGYASWYLDDNDVDRNSAGDGKPDRNGKFGGCFVNAGDPKWFDVLDEMRLDGPDGRAGLREILTTTHGRGLGCDGVFLDTIDTAAPNPFTDASHVNPSEFEWTAPGFRSFIARVRGAYPGALLLQNRGLFFFDPRHPHYLFNARGLVDFVLFESFRLNSNPFEQYDPLHYADNRFNLAPKLMAEANRPDGFQVLSMGYAEGPGVSEATLRGQSTEGLETLLEDIRVAHAQGFRHFLTVEKVRASTFVRDRADLTDREPPVWSSTYNVNRSGGLPAAPTARVGIQEVVPGPGRLTVRWDVALDMNPVRYVLYLRASPFAADLSGATRIELVPEAPPNYAHAPDAYAHQATVTGLAPGTTYHLILRARDTAGNEEGNRVILTGVPQ